MDTWINPDSHTRKLRRKRGHTTCSRLHSTGLEQAVTSVSKARSAVRGGWGGGPRAHHKCYLFAVTFMTYCEVAHTFMTPICKEETRFGEDKPHPPEPQGAGCRAGSETPVFWLLPREPFLLAVPDPGAGFKNMFTKYLVCLSSKGGDSLHCPPSSSLLTSKMWQRWQVWDFPEQVMKSTVASSLLSRIITLGKASWRVVRTLKERSTWQGTEVSCQEPCQ